MRIDLVNFTEGFWYFNLNDIKYQREQYNYAFKYLNFDKLNKHFLISFIDKKTKNDFYKKYTDAKTLISIYSNHPEGYEWLKNNWGKDVFRIGIYYSDKQELKTIVNRVINVELKRSMTNEN